MTTSYAKAKAKYAAKHPSAGEEDDHQPVAKTCFAEGCPMAAALSDGGRGHRWCGYHHGIRGEDLPRVTSVMNEHHDLRDVINHARRLAVNSELSDSSMRAEWRKLRDLLLFAGYDDPKSNNLTQWIYACELMLNAHVFAMLKSTSPAPLQQRMAAP